MSFLRRAPFIKRRSAGSANLYLEMIDVLAQDEFGDGAGEWYCKVGFRFNTDGSVVSLVQIGPTPFGSEVETFLFNWLIGGSASNYDIKITNVVVGTPIGLTVDTRYQLNADRTVYIDASWSGAPSTGSLAQADFDVQLIDHSTGAVLKSDVVALYALAGT